MSSIEFLCARAGAFEFAAQVARDRGDMGTANALQALADLNRAKAESPEPALSPQQELT